MHKLSLLLLIPSLLVACSSDAKNTDGNADPKSATCDTRAVMACSSGSVCHRFYSQTAADKVRSDCRDLGETVTPDCASTYVACCIHLEGSNEYPEGICVEASRVSELKAQCNSAKYVWCGP